MVGAMRSIGSPLAATAAALHVVVRRLDTATITVVATLGYLAAFLWAARDLTYRPDVEAGLVVVHDPSTAMMRRTGPASFDAIAILDTGVVRLLVSPLNIAIGLSIAVLVGLSLAMAYLAIVQPTSCGIGAGSGAVASLPALLSGTVCCGPVILLVLGLQATGLIMSAFAWLLPVAVVLLLGSLIYLATKLDVHHAHQPAN